MNRARSRSWSTALVARLLPLALAFGVCYPLLAQRSRDPLTPQQEDQIREVADQPNERIKLYLQFIDERTDTIHQTVRRPADQHPGADIHTAMEEFTRLVDELEDNIDAYDQQHVDARKGLKLAIERSSKWSGILNEPPSSPEYDFARKTAIEAADSLHQAATEVSKSQEEYFGKHKPPKK